MVAMLHLMQMGHRWAHIPAERRSGMVTAMQGVGFIIGQPEHDQHHVPPYKKDFCIMTGMCNRPLNATVRVFGATSHLWILVFLATCFVPVAVGLAWQIFGA